MQIDITSYFNHRIKYYTKYEKIGFSNTKSIYGVNGITITEKIDTICCNKIQVGICSNSNGDYDNIACDGQKIFIDSIIADSINIIGFCEFGTVSEELKIYDNDICHSFEFVLKTFHTNANQGIDNSERNNKCQLIAKFMGNDNQKHNFYSYKIDFYKKLIVKSITLPINLSLHILAIQFG